MPSSVSTKRLSIWLLCLLFVFVGSFFFIDVAKTRNNIFYAGFALPVLIWTLASWRSALQMRSQSLLLLLVFFAAMATVDIIFLRENMYSELKHSIYLLMFFIGLQLIVDQPRYEGYWIKAWGCFALLCLLYATGKWLWVYQQTGQLVRLQMAAAASNPVHAALMISSGISAFWLFVIEPRLQRFTHLVLGGLLIAGLQVWVALIFDARSALSGTILFLTGWALFRERGARLLLGLAVVVGLTLYLTGLLDLFMSRGASYRLVIWQDVLQRLVHHCGVAFGCGKDDYRFLGEFFHPHSGYLSVLYRYGAFVAVIGALWIASYWYWGVRMKSRWFLVSLIGWGGLVTTGAGLLSSPQPFWLYFWMPTMLSMIEVRRLHRINTNPALKEPTYGN
ncbi:hypothetical protein T3A99_10535 [Pseudomonas sp. N-137]|uniref:hypothetical protein n=1 Tax=unclassified Pseudomonas TaxID=196821 RepID=UPI0023646F17|nr:MULTISPECIES: hypothetical protein [unclassified Pseudomonas]MDD2031893.1 hypothetical protein [Pseudomonas sp. 39167]MEA1029000.1 hypothetical protein [Pseudomonas sp. N-137]